MKAARLAAVDLARGLALWAMLGFHMTWDLAHFGWIDPDAVDARAFHWLGHAIAISFLALVGFSLVLADEARGPLWRSPKYWRRWGEIALSAGAISAASYWLFPATPIFFGILHCIALASLVALAFLRAPPVVALGAGVLALLAPHFLASSVFDAKIFWWTGLGTFEPPSNDYQPLLPLLGVVLFGLALGRWVRLPLPVSTGRGRRVRGRGFLPQRLRRPQSQDLSSVEANAPAPRRSPLPARGARGLNRALAFCGRHSLSFYLVHQPLLFGLFTAIGLVVAPPPDARIFLRQCAVQCVNDGAAADICEQSCACVMNRAQKDGVGPNWRATS